jgi:3-oxoacyl-[acyl-carrier-protein] synthase-3
MSGIRIYGTGSYVPPKILSNQDLVKKGLDVSDEWIVRRTGIHERRIAAPDVATSDLAFQAAIAALESAHMAPSELDVIIVATITPDTCCPSAANWLQAHLDAPQAVSFDITAACSGFIFALNVASQYLKAGAARQILVVASEVMSRTLDWEDRSTCILWGDGAGAAVLGMGKSGPELLSTHIHTDGANGKNLLLPGGGSITTPISRQSVEAGRHSLNMIQANRSFKLAVKYFIRSIREAAEHNAVRLDGIDWFVPHQANIRMFQTIADMLHLPFDRFYLTIGKYGNISSASCAIALDEAVRDGSIHPGDRVCLPVFGGGLTWGSAMMRW